MGEKREEMGRDSGIGVLRPLSYLTSLIAELNHDRPERPVPTRFDASESARINSEGHSDGPKEGVPGSSVALGRPLSTNRRVNIPEQRVKASNFFPITTNIYRMNHKSAVRIIVLVKIWRG